MEEKGEEMLREGTEVARQLTYDLSLIVAKHDIL